MDLKPLILILILLIAVSSPAAASGETLDEAQSTYIIHVSPSQTPLLLTTATAGTASHHLLRRAYKSFLHSILPPHLHQPKARILYAYSHATSGFSARLTQSQLAHLTSHPAILAMLPDQARFPHITHSPAFLKLSPTSGLLPASNFASDVIVGVLDTGVYPISRRSFAASESSTPPPSSFRGKCVSTASFNASEYCNNKLIGAKFFYKGYEAGMGHPIDETKESKSPLDTEGHGTHTASTAAGSVVDDAGFFNYARGKAAGMASSARIAAYKICWASGCYDSDILAAMDAAVADGVDVISLSVGSSGYPSRFNRDSIAIGAFGATRKGVVVSCSAGNSGPGAFTAVNIAPWILTVGASTIDREFPADVELGDGSVYGGVSLYAGEPLETAKLPLVYAGECGSRLCIMGELDSAKVAGKIVVCDRGSNARVEKGAAVHLAGGAGLILANTEESGEELIADSHLVPATMVGQTFGDKIKKYISSDPSPTATIIFRGTVIGSSSTAAPQVAAFSSRGPNYRAQEILKPDVIAPGVNILAAWTGAASPTDLTIDSRRVEFNIISGTSMSCPHVSGIAALLCQVHPEWSPAAVKSALMTTAYNVDTAGGTIRDLATGAESTPFVRGAGHVDPNSALDPGLIYDIGVDDYVAFLCTMGYGPEQIAVFTRDGSVANCSTKLALPGDLNYPAFSVVFASYGEADVTYHRVVRNVGSNANAVYEVQVSAPDGVDVTVKPSKLAFDAAHQSLAYEITFKLLGNPIIINGKYTFGSVVWSDGTHAVRSPIAVTWPENDAVYSM